MRAVIQRVKESSVKVDRQTIGRIGKGLLVLIAMILLRLSGAGFLLGAENANRKQYAYTCLATPLRRTPR